MGRGIGFDQFDVDNRFWIADAAVIYRLPARRGQFTLGVSNLFDRDLSGYQDIDSANPLFARRRFTFARVSIQF